MESLPESPLESGRAALWVGDARDGLAGAKRLVATTLAALSSPELRSDEAFWLGWQMARIEQSLTSSIVGLGYIFSATWLEELKPLLEISTSEEVSEGLNELRARIDQFDRLLAGLYERLSERAAAGLGDGSALADEALAGWIAARH